MIPCLNEEGTVGLVVQQAAEGFRQSGYPFEILVADNGSQDRSRAVAEQAGAKVIDVPTKGYGAALRAAIAKAQGSIIIFGDADLTYDFREGPPLIDRLQIGDVDLVLGTRIRGSIEPGAMPWIHHYVGTPILTYLIRILFGSKLSDSNSGFRAFRAQTFNQWKIYSNGMEICSEVIVNCLKSGGRIAEVPITLRKDRRVRAPHLSTWPDGTRNLLIILSRAPHVFSYLGLILLLGSALVAIPSALMGHGTIGPFSLFEHHSMVLAILFGFFGSQMLFYGFLVDADSERPLAINRIFLQIDELRLLKMLACLSLVTLCFVAFIFIRWIQHHFNNINYLLPSLAVLYCAVVVGGLGFGIFIVHVLKRGPRAMEPQPNDAPNG